MPKPVMPIPTFTIRITNSRSDTVWYNDKVGETFTDCWIHQVPGEPTGECAIIDKLKCWVFPGDYEIVNE